MINQVQKRLKNQDTLNLESDRLRTELLAEVGALRSNLTEAKREILAHSHSVQTTRLQLSAIEARVHGLNQQRAKLEQASREYGAKGPQAMSHVPFEFFSELHREYQRILDNLQQELDQTEALAKAVFSHKREEEPQDQPPLRAKVFEVCRMLLEQQKAVSRQLYQVDLTVRDLKSKYTRLVEARNPDMSREQIERQITRGATAESLAQSLTSAKTSHESAKLAEIVGNKLKLDLLSMFEKDKPAPVAQGRPNLAQSLYSQEPIVSFGLSASKSREEPEQEVYFKRHRPSFPTREEDPMPLAKRIALEATKKYQQEQPKPTSTFNTLQKSTTALGLSKKQTIIPGVYQSQKSLNPLS